MVVLWEFGERYTIIERREPLATALPINGDELGGTAKIRQADDGKIKNLTRCEKDII